METKFKLFNSSLIIVMLCILTSCSKEKKTEKALTKSDGVWTVNSVDWTHVQNNLGNGINQSVTQGTSANVGTFTFKDGGTGSYSCIIDSIMWQQNFSWTVDGENITVSHISQNINSNGIDQIVVSFSGSESGKTSLTLTGSETHQSASSSIEQSNLTATFHLSK